jgi:hypothetical protein
METSPATNPQTLVLLHLDFVNILGENHQNILQPTNISQFVILVKIEWKKV